MADFLSTLDPSKHPVTRRTLRREYQAPELGRIKVAFFDADGTLRVSQSGNVTASHPTDVVLLPNVAKKIEEVRKKGYLIAIASNQAGIPKHVSLTDADLALKYTIKLLNDAGATVDYYDFAESYNVFRKPDVGMPDLATRVIEMTTGFSVNWKRSFMVGDGAWKKGVDMKPDGTPGTDFSNSDRLLAERLYGRGSGFGFHEPHEFFGWDRERYNRASDL